jgi:hyperosmotically inducible protein
MPKQQSTREAITDGVIAARVKAALVVDPLTVASDIHVETLAGIVQLTGFVETIVVRDAALQIAWDVEGVQQVNDSLDIRVAH